MKRPFSRIAIIGVGLIGGSLGIAVRNRGLAREVIGYDQSREALSKAIRAKAIDGSEEDLHKAVEGADLVILATPMGSFEGLASKLAPLLHPKTVVTDVGSTKGTLVKRLEKQLSPNGLFVGGHPIAGREKSGVEAASENLFDNALCILTPTPHTEPEALKLIQSLWESVGSHVVLMDPKRHDRILAAVSHLPHVVAYALVTLMGELSTAEPDLLTYSAGGFRDFTRIAASSPEMWRDICLANRDEIIRLIERYEKTMKRFKKLIQDKDAAALKEQFEAAKAIRERLNKQATG